MSNNCPYAADSGRSTSVFLGDCSGSCCSNPFAGGIYIDGRLRLYCSTVAGYKSREIISGIDAYLQMDTVADKMLVLYGLRRTGKTVLMLQEAQKYYTESVYMLCTKDTSILDILGSIDFYRQKGKRYFFIDEVTFCKDFASKINLLPSLVGFGIRIVCTGTDSFGFHMVRQLLYDRKYILHTTYISYKEYRGLKGGSVDDYIRDGGFFLEGEADPEHPDNITLPHMIDEQDRTLRSYLDTSIAHNILNSFRMIKDSNLAEYEPLFVAYERGLLPQLLTIALNCHGFHFAAKQLLKELSPQSIAQPAHVLSDKIKRWRDGKYNPGESPMSEEQLNCIQLILEEITQKEFISSYYSSLKVDGPLTGIDEERVQQYVDLLSAYLRELDVVCIIQQERLIEVGDNLQIVSENRAVFSQMGMRYGYTKQAIQMLSRVQTASPVSRKKVRQELETVALGELLEIAVTVNVMKTLAKTHDVFKCIFNLNRQSGNGEFDLVVRDKETMLCHIFEIKHSDKAVTNQAKHLMNQDFCNAFEEYEGEIVSKAILYNGDSGEFDGVTYYNISDFLCNIENYVKDE